MRTNNDWRQQNGQSRGGQRGRSQNRGQHGRGGHQQMRGSRSGQHPRDDQGRFEPRGGDRSEWSRSAESIGEWPGSDRDQDEGMRSMGREDASMYGQYGDSDFGYGGSEGFDDDQDELGGQGYQGGYDMGAMRGGERYGNNTRGGQGYMGGYGLRGPGGGFGTYGAGDQWGQRGWNDQAGREGERGWGDQWGNRSDQGQQRYAKGPKGYQRSDERIREDLSDRLMQMHHIDSSDVEVSVSSGEVTLTGTVPDREMKHHIERLADTIPGVNEITNQLKVKRDDKMSGSQSSGGSQSMTGESGGKSRKEK